MVKTSSHFDHRHVHMTSWHMSRDSVQDDVTYAKMCLPSRVSDTMRRFSPLESSKKLQGKNARGVVPTPPPGRPRVNDSIETQLSRQKLHPERLESQ